MKAGELRIGEMLSTMGGSVTVVNVQTVARGVRVYNIEVDGTHTFFANGMLVHNMNLPGLTGGSIP